MKFNKNYLKINRKIEQLFQRKCKYAAVAVAVGV